MSTEQGRDQPSGCESAQCRNFRRHGLPALLVGAVAFGAASAWLIDGGLDSARAEHTLATQLHSPDAYGRYKQGQIDTSKVVVLRAGQTATADEYAQQVAWSGADVHELASQVAPQAAAQGSELVDPDDVLVLRLSEVNVGKVLGQVVVPGDCLRMGDPFRCAE